MVAGVWPAAENVRAEQIRAEQIRADEGGTVLKVERLLSMWDGQRDAIHTAHLAFRRFRRRLDAAEADRATWNRAFDELPPRPDAVRLKRFLSVASREVSDLNPPWSVYEFWWDDPRLRERGELLDHVFDGTTEIIREPANRFIKLYEPRGTVSRWRRPHLHDFRVIPDARVRASDVRVRECVGDRCELDLPGGTRLSVDTRTGDILQFTVGEDGIVRHEVRQAAFREVEGVRFPQLVLRTDFDGRGRVAMVWMTLVDRMEFNQPLAPDTFVVSAEEGELIRDRRMLPDRDFRVEAPVGDVMQVMGRTVAAEPDSGTGRRRVLWLVLVNAVAFAGFLLVVWLRRWQRARRQLEQVKREGDRR